jgi:fimbrial chaperone protein
MNGLARKLILFFSALSLAWSGVASASLRVDPFIIYIIPNGQGSSSVVQLTNVTDVQLPFEATVVKRTVVDGHEVDVPAEDDFVIFPPQMIIRPHETQTLRIQWIVGQAPTTSESYYVYVTQIPADVQPNVTGIRISYRFGISVHVVPANTSPNFEVTGLRPATNAAGVHGFQLDVRNGGARFGRMSEHELTLDGTHSWDRAALKTAVGTGFMLPGERITFFVPYDGPVTASSTAVLANRGPA